MTDNPFANGDFADAFGTDAERADPPSPLHVLPSPTDANGKAPLPGRAADGTFVAGNTYGKGNPLARRQAALRSALLDTVTSERLQAIVEQLYQLAMSGDTTAAALLLAYSIGRPAKAPDPDMTEGMLSVEALLTFANTVLLAAKAVIPDDDVVRRLQERVLAMLPRPDLDGEPTP
jgi:hypothetical protein